MTIADDSPTIPAHSMDARAQMEARTRTGSRLASNQRFQQAATAADPTAWDAINRADLGFASHAEREALIAENEALHQRQQRRKR